jgi:uncharacterized membrane protein
MSYQEKTVLVSLFSYLLVWGYYLINVFQMYQAGSLNSAKVFSLWGTVIVLIIVITIVANILTQIVSAIIYAILTRSDKTERMVEDERDKLIGLKGTQVSYIVFSVGVLIAMISFVANQPPLVMFNLLIFASITAEVVGSLTQLILYRRGV